MKHFWGKCPLEAKAHSLTMHYQDQEEQKKGERKHPHETEVKHLYQWHDY